jgi:lycopene cyclase
VLVEHGERFGGRHVWSFFASDVASTDAWLVEPLVAARWDGYEVRFPGHSRVLSTPYRSILSENLDAALRAALPADALLDGAEVLEAGQERVVAGGRAGTAGGGVIDARGATAMPHMAGAGSASIGELLRLDHPHGLARPIVMDAWVEQTDGYRFVYCLPFSATEVFVEDTFYTDDPRLDRAAMRRRCMPCRRTRMDGRGSAARGHRRAAGDRHGRFRRVLAGPRQRSRARRAPRRTDASADFLLAARHRALRPLHFGANLPPAQSFGCGARRGEL